MTVIDEWTGRHAHALRAALRLTNEAFAEYLGVAPRTISKWRERPEMVPSPHLQEALDTALARAPAEALTRFAANLGEPEQRVTLDQAALGQLNAAVTDLARLLSRIEFAGFEVAGIEQSSRQ
ncbi:hypothetical protein Kfla_4687 [Kribbella flavida DSM 17836]|uniref:HTH cro/C1-type domain-containing protein n=1 Tax=Kribbella flavida (strain DSM 17836 / JCM 10339 / NBRC 14399) TaxID=479435 RepID=D2PZ95_KRIFD|nr:helix-turn-helix transcriptional regulator [Kribbella flavida]ADB33704.1 hypothetical protein Kfla_4687 [Kribbella flavida DSM 17836]